MLVNDRLNEMTGIEMIEEAVDTTTGIEIDDDDTDPDLGLDLDQETDTLVDIQGEIEAGPDPGPEIDDETDTKLESMNNYIGRRVSNKIKVQQKNINNLIISPLKS